MARKRILSTEDDRDSREMIVLLLRNIMADEVVTIAKKDWEQIDLAFRVPSTVNLSFRIDEQIVSQTASNIKIRNLVVSESHIR